MPSHVRYKKKYMMAAMPFVLLLSACSMTSPHENFKVGLNKAVGTSVDIDPMLSPCALAQKNRVGQESLANGNVEYKYIARGKGICYYYCEVDPRTQTVVRIRFEGGGKDCVIYP